MQVSTGVAEMKANDIHKYCEVLHNAALLTCQRTDLVAVKLRGSRRIFRQAEITDGGETTWLQQRLF